MYLLYFGLFIIAYLLGSIPTAVWVGKRFYGIDVREHGSRNAGATNTLRVLGRRAALPVFSVDLLKGSLAVILAQIPFFVDEGAGISILYLQVAYAIAAALGHMFPIFAGFKGGKGVATIAGAMLAIAPMAVVCSLLTFFVVLMAFSYVSLASITAGAAFPFYLRFFFGAEKDMVIFGIIVSLLLIYTHRKNITRLLIGSENKTYVVKKRRVKEPEYEDDEYEYDDEYYDDEYYEEDEEYETRTKK